MTIVINMRDRIDERKLRVAARLIREGKLVAFPTETVYGLGADALNEKAARRIFEAKGRPADNPLIVHIAEFSQVYELAREVPEEAKMLAKKFWPGPLTIVLPRREIVPDVTTGGLDTVAIRMPANEIALKLIKLSGRPIAAPSANISGKPSPTTAEHVADDFYGKIECIIDGGETKIGVESTVIDLTEWPPVLLRPGGLPLEEIEKVIGEVRIHPAVFGKKVDIPRKLAMLRSMTPLGIEKLTLPTLFQSSLIVRSKRIPTIVLIKERTRKLVLQLKVRAIGTTIRGVIPEPIGGPIMNIPRAEPFLFLNISLIKAVAGA